MSETKYRKKLIEVALPLDGINKGCTEDKNRKTGHIRNLHKWFAPMPLPSWRAMLFATLVDDPGDDEAERRRLVQLIERLAAFNAFTDEALLVDARQAIHASLGNGPPVLVADPFCGGGSTLLEAQRLGLNAWGADLNPVPVLISTVLCRVAPMFAETPSCSPSSPKLTPMPSRRLEGFLADVRYFAERVRARALDRLSVSYPDSDDGVPFAYRWAWSVPSPEPSAAGCYTPLVSDWWLSRNKSGKAYVRPIVQNGAITFEIHSSGEPPEATVIRRGARCLLTRTPITFAYIREQGRAGNMKPVLLAIAVRQGRTTRYLPPDSRQIAAARAGSLADNAGIDLPAAALSFRVQQYGFSNFLDLFSPRQALSLGTFAQEVGRIHPEIVQAARALPLPQEDTRALEQGGCGARAYADSVCAVLGLCVGRMAQSNSVLVRWFIDPRNGSGKATPAFERHAIPMVWDFVETNPFGGSVGDWTGPVLDTALRAFDLCAFGGAPATVLQADARDAGKTIPAPFVVATDPPYYANIGYADLSDYFYLWLRPALRSIFPSLFGTIATPKSNELIASPFRHDGDKSAADVYFRAGFQEVFAGLRSGLDDRFPLSIVYALKQSEDASEDGGTTGWEVFLGGLIDGGLAVVATWPIRTATSTRMIGLGTNSLASAIFVVCRPRDPGASLATRAEFLRALRRELPAAIGRLRASSIAPVDMAQAVVGPGIGVFCSYSGILETNGEAMTVGTALALVNQVADELRELEEGALDGDSRFATTWFQQYQHDAGVYGEAETLARARNVSVAGLAEAGVVKSGGGKVRLLKRSELADDWDPTKDSRITTWEATQQLIKRLEDHGEAAAAELLDKLGSLAGAARDLAYRLYSTCERKGWTDEARAYNGLVVAWPDLERLAAQAREASKAPTQQRLL